VWDVMDSVEVSKGILMQWHAMEVLS